MSTHQSSRKPPAPFLQVLAGAVVFLAFQYAMSLWKLASNTADMANKFSALAKEKHLGFLIRENLWMLLAYALLALAATLLIQPLVHHWTTRSKSTAWQWVVARSLLLVALIHGYFTLRLMQTRPYFINEAEFGHWYYKAFDFLPEGIKPTVFLMLFTLLPLAAAAAALIWHARRHGRRGWIALACLVVAGGLTPLVLDGLAPRAIAAGGTTRPQPPNILIIGSDSLRGDHLGCNGHVPARKDGLAAAGISPRIDALAARSINFKSCYTSIASTLESGVQLMSSQYPHTHGIRQMYPDRDTVEATNARITPLARLLREKGYDTAAIGDWCAGYYHVAPLGMEHISASNFDNFKIYMSQAVVMAHFVIPLYFDNALGYRLYPQLQSFAQFVTPQVVTKRVDERLAQVAAAEKPFFWHVFFSCNHLPYRTPEPYNSMFADPAYEGPNRTGVDFDIDRFIGGTDLESKWQALPPDEAKQIRALYEGCTRYFDDCVGRILDSLERSGLADRTIVIITSDHGDDLYEPGVTLGHGLTFNGALHANHVPMVVHVPGMQARVIEQTVRLIDVAPTLAELTGTPIQSNWEGQSFAPWLDGRQTPNDRPVYAETGFPFIQFSVKGVQRPPLPPMDQCTMIDDQYNYQFVVKPEYRQRIIDAKQRCLKTRNWKLVCTPTATGERHFSLHHLASDPTGIQEVSEQHPEVLAAMRQALETWIDQHRETPIEAIFPQGEP